MQTSPSTRVLRRAGLVLAGATLFGGCLQDRLAWSPDGQHAAVITAEGLHLAKPAGRLSPLLAPRVYRAAWLPDSRGLVLARKREAKTFTDVAAALGPDRTRALVAKAESVWNRLKVLPRSEKFDPIVARDIGGDLAGVLAYLREQPAALAALREKFGADWKQEDEGKPVDLHEVITARLSADTLELGSPLWVGLPGIHTLRPAPGGQAVAFTMEGELSAPPGDGVCVLLAPLDASQPAVVVATQSSTDPDWTPGGRDLVYFKAPGPTAPADDLRLGALVQRTVLDAAGRLHLAPESSDLAGLIFHQRSRVRCLGDGRILFNATPITLPTTGLNDEQHEQLFVLDRTPSPSLRPLLAPDTLAHLPNALSAFAVSPDNREVLLGSDHGEVWRLTLASGVVEAIATRLDEGKAEGEGENYPAPVWRGPGEFTYLRLAAGGPRTFELVLRRGQEETVLSRGWDPALLRRLIE